MQSLVLEKPGELKLKEVDIPKYGCNEVLIKVISAGICHTDFVIMRGQYSWANHPCVLGYEFSGIMEKISPGVTHVVNVREEDPHEAIMDITHRFSLAEYEKAFYTVLNKKDGVIKAIFNIGIE